MEPVTPFSLGAFGAIVLIVAVTVVLGFRRAGLGVLVVGILIAYLALPGILARSRILDRYNPLPAPALLLILGLTLLTIVIICSAPGGRLAARVPLGAILTLQSFRIGVEWWLHRMFAEGVVPVQMTYSGRNFDLVTGITGLVLGIWVLRGGALHRGVVWAWNIMGLLLLGNIVAVAVLSTPVPFRRFMDPPPNLLPSTFPYVWLPSFLVQVALGSHLLVFRQLRRNRSRSRTTPIVSGRR
jgi:hypothetical protein